MFRFRATIAAVLLASTGAALAAPVVYFGNLSGPAESPPNASPGTGQTLVTIDGTGNTMSVHVSFADLLGTTTVSHIHCCTADPGVLTAGVATTTPSFPNFPPSVTSGTYDHTFDMTLSSSYNPSFVTANGGTAAGAEAALFAGIAAGKAYLDIHTNLYAGGEIRSLLIPDKIFANGFDPP